MRLRRRRPCVQCGGDLDPDAHAWRTCLRCYTLIVRYAATCDRDVQYHRAAGHRRAVHGCGVCDQIVQWEAWKLLSPLGAAGGSAPKRSD